ncbi:MAG: metallophosphoesterase family protein [Chloroflexi bacterium]|nr:metallophosphoesterase family protein [Chloroflexota bacterium]
MKIGIVSDIHCNVEALESALRAMHHVDEIFCAGDAVNGFRWSNDVIDLLRLRGAHMVLGNHDRDFLQVHKERSGSNGYISPENREFIHRLGFRHEVELGGRRILMVHASPFDPYFEYIFPNSQDFRRLAELEADLFIYGHTHFPVAQRVGEVTVVNPGSVGQPRDPSRPSKTYAIVDLATLEVAIHDIDEVGVNGASPSANGSAWQTA